MTRCRPITNAANVLARQQIISLNSHQTNNLTYHDTMPANNHTPPSLGDQKQIIQATIPYTTTITTQTFTTVVNKHKQRHCANGWIYDEVLTLFHSFPSINISSSTKALQNHHNGPSRSTVVCSQARYHIFPLLA